MLNSTPLPVDITNITNQTDFLRLVEELNRTHRPRALKQGNKTVAMLLPADTAKKPKQGDYEGILKTFGSWKHVDTARLKEDLYAARQKTNARPPVTL